MHLTYPNITEDILTLPGSRSQDVCQVNKKQLMDKKLMINIGFRSEPVVIYPTNIQSVCVKEITYVKIQKTQRKTAPAKKLMNLFKTPKHLCGSPTRCMIERTTDSQSFDRHYVNGVDQPKNCSTTKSSYQRQSNYPTRCRAPKQ